MADPTAIPTTEWHRRTDNADLEAGTWVFRQDRGELLGSKPGPGGSLLVTGYAAREGVLVYRNADGTTTREFVPLQTLKDSAKTLGRAPVTLEHPRCDVTPENIAALGVGDVGSKITIHDDGYVEVTAAVRRKDALDAVRGGKVEFSPGYRVRIDSTPGVHPVHGPYDAVQVERVVNHLAIVGNARGGETIRFRVDAADATETISAGHPALTLPPNRGSGMIIPPRLGILLARLGVQTRFDNVETGIDLAIDAIDARHDSADKAARERNDALASAVTDRDAATARADAADTAHKAEKARADKAEAEVGGLEAADKARTDAAERADLVELSGSVKVDASKYPSSPDLRIAIAKAHRARGGGELRADASDAYLDVILDEVRDARKDSAVGRETGAQVWTDAADRSDARTDGASAPRRSILADRWSGRPMNARGGE